MATIPKPITGKRYVLELDGFSLSPQRVGFLFPCELPHPPNSYQTSVGLIGIALAPITGAYDMPGQIELEPRQI